jgi:mono/diheme cytochrome c family protein
MDTLGWIQGRPAPPLESNGEVDAAALVNKLLDRGADPNAKLKRAILKRHHDFQAERVLTEGATPLMRAARFGDARLARILLARGADPTLTTKDGTNALLFAAGVNLAAVRGEDPSLLHPSEDGSIEIIKMLLDRGMDINAANEQGLTALHGAVQRGQGVGNGSGEKIIALLAERGAKLDVKDKKGRTPLELARAGQGLILNRVEDSGPAARLLAKLSGEPVESAAGTLSAKAADPGKPVELARSQKNTNLWTGVYTSAQADRGQAAYHLYCRACHGDNLAGGQDAVGRAPSLRGEKVLGRKDVNNLFSYIRVWMPEDDRGSLDDRTVVDIVSYILNQNAFPAGAEELVADAESLKKILIVKKPE